MTETHQDIRKAIIALPIGQTADFPVERWNYVRVTASNVGLELNRKYRTQTKRDDRVITVIRES